MRATVFLIIICFVAYPFGIKYHELLCFRYSAFVDKMEWWRVITAMFIHANLLHLLGNMLFLFLFGKGLENKIGSFRLLLCFLTGGVVNFLSSYFFYNHNEPIVGASGAISTIIGLLMIYDPWKISFLLNLFPMPLGVAALTYMFLNVFLAHAQNKQNYEGLHTAYELHVMGFLVGIVFGIIWNKDWKKNLLICIISFIAFYVIIWAFIYYLKTI